MTKKISYKDAGVDIAAGNELVGNIKDFTNATKRTGVMGEIGGFGGLFSLKELGLKDPILVSATDGVGTKLKIAQDINYHDEIGYDLVAMCVNDLIVQGAEPLFFLDYYACAKLENDVATKVVKSIASACIEAGCALIGGETAEMPGMYQKGDYDLAGFAVGAVERTAILPKLEKIKQGDVIIGLPANGIHSNGFSLIRKIINDNNYDYNKIYDFSEGKTLAEFLLKGTKLYVKPLQTLFKKDKIKALAHITGGGIIENIPRVLPENLDFKFFSENIPTLLVYEWLANYVASDDLYLTFNAGVGMALIVAESEVDEVVSSLRNNGEDAFILGEVYAKA